MYKGYNSVDIRIGWDIDDSSETIWIESAAKNLFPFGHILAELFRLTTSLSLLSEYLFRIGNAVGLIDRTSTPLWLCYPSFNVLFVSKSKGNFLSNCIIISIV